VDTAEQPDEKADSVYEFDGLETPPEVSSSRPVRVSRSQLMIWVPWKLAHPCIFRRIQVDKSSGMRSRERRAVQVQVFVDAPYEPFVTKDARFGTPAA